MDVVVIGDTAKDINIFKGRTPKGSYEKDTKVVNNGGACFYSSVGASIFGNCGVVTKIGEDFDINNYRKFGIDVTGVSMVNGKTTRFFQTFLTRDGQEREFRAERNPETKISIQDIPLEYLGNSKYIFLSTTLPENQLQLIKDIRKVSKAKIVVDTLKEFSEDSVTRQVFDNADIAFIDREFETLINSKAKIKIIKYGKVGCLYLDENNQYIFNNKRIIPDDEVIDKTGAGDVLIGSFLAVLSRTNNPQIALEKANAIATESILQYGVEHLRENVRRMEEFEK
ncbi:MAG: carbohydrate kinase family protein [Clostridia bacterium]|nr:carbohydrate kinase family protein [Clostridia bacterium]